MEKDETVMWSVVLHYIYLLLTWPSQLFHGDSKAKANTTHIECLPAVSKGSNRADFPGLSQKFGPKVLQTPLSISLLSTAIEA